MSKMNFKCSGISLYAIALLSFISCTTKETINPIPISGNAKVYVAGTANLSGEYWNNMVTVPLYFQYPAFPSRATSIFVSNNDVYVSGYGTIQKSSNPNTFSTVAMYWKNGLPVSLTDGKYEAIANSIFIIDSDVYVAGSENGKKGSVAKYWKNGVPTILSDTTKQGYANSVYVSGSDVYVAGDEIRGLNLRSANYWKNGVRFVLSDTTRWATATSIFVSGNDLYVSGNEQTVSHISVAKYWKNGLSIPLTDGTTTGAANSIFVSGPDVYLTGAINSTPVYWKNGMTGILSTPEGGTAITTSIFVSDSDVYISGFQFDPIRKNNVSYYWKNGVAYTITDGTNSATAAGLFVVK